MLTEAFVIGFIVKVMEKTVIASINGQQKRLNIAGLGLSRERLLELQGKRLEFSLRGQLVFRIELTDD
jgi:hypothetical protein